MWETYGRRGMCGREHVFMSICAVAPELPRAHFVKIIILVSIKRNLRLIIGVLEKATTTVGGSPTVFVSPLSNNERGKDRIGRECKQRKYYDVVILRTI